MYQVISLATADKPYYMVICRYIEKDSQKKRKLVIPIRDLKPSSNDVLGHFQALESKIRFNHATLLNSIDNKLFVKCLLVGYYHSLGSSELQSIEMAEKLIKMEVKANNRRVSFREPPEAIKYATDTDEEDIKNTNGTHKQETITTVTNDYAEDDEDFVF